MTEGDVVSQIGEDFHKEERLVEGRAKEVLFLPSPGFIGSVRYVVIDKATRRVDEVVCDD
jgi:hypothetical protein